MSLFKRSFLCTASLRSNLKTLHVQVRATTAVHSAAEIKYARCHAFMLQLQVHVYMIRHD